MGTSARTDRNLAWELHVEVASRIATVALPHGEGLLQDATRSLYTLFSRTREILAGSDPNDEHWHEVASRLLEHGLRPFLTRWHPRLDAYLDTKPPQVSLFDYQQSWEHNLQFREELSELQVLLREVADLLAEMAGARSLTTMLKGVR